MAKEVSCCDLCLCVGIISEKKDTSVKIHILNQCLYVSVLREVAPLKNKMPDEVKLPDFIPFYLHCFEVKLIECGAYTCAALQCLVAVGATHIYTLIRERVKK